MQSGVGGAQTANSSTNALRILSRVAAGLRLVRIIINLRHARALRSCDPPVPSGPRFRLADTPTLTQGGFGGSGKMQGKLRGLVSQNRRRFLKHGFDLDCTYITSRVRPLVLPPLYHEIPIFTHLWFPNSLTLAFMPVIQTLKNTTDDGWLELQVIAMSAPVFGRHSSYRNDIHVVSR